MKIKNILSGLGVIAMAMLTACGDDDVSESGIFGTPTDGAYFSDNLPSKIELDKNASSFEVTVTRTSTQGTFTAEIASTNPAGLFSIPSSVTFADGSATAPITIGYSADQLVGDENYNLSFEITQGLSDYGPGTYSVTVFKPGDWTPWQLLPNAGTYTYSIYWEGEDGPCPVYTRKSVADPNIMQYCFGSVGMNDANGKPIPASQQFGLMYGVNMYVNRDLTTNYCRVPEMWTGVFNTNYNENVMCADTYSYSGQAQFMEKSFYNPETGLFTLNMYYYISLGGFGQGNEYFQLGGFSDYSMDVERRGNYVEGNKESALFFVYKGEDIELYRYTVASGSLTQEQVDAAVKELDAAEDAKELTESGMIAFDFAENGTYTVILVGYAENEIKTVVSKEFKVETVQGSGDWESMGYVAYTDGYICSLYPAAVPEPYYVEVQAHKNVEGYYRLVNPYGEAFPYNQEGDYDPNTNSYLLVNACDPEYVYIEESESTTNWGQGAFAFSSQVYNFLGKYDIETIKKNNIPAGKFADGAITFDLKALLIFVGADGYYANNWISNYDDYKNNGVDPVYAATEKIDFKDLVSKPAARSMVSKDYVKVAKANAKRSMFGNVKAPAKISKTAKTSDFNGRMVTLKRDVKTIELSESATF